MTRLMAMIAALLASAAVTQAQTIQGCGGPSGTPVLNPTSYCFESPDWNDTNFGSPLVSGAKIYVYTQGSDTTGAALVTVDIGRPTAQAGKTADNYYVLKGPFAKPNALAADGTTLYVSVIEEQLAGGAVKRSAPGNPFGYSKAPDSRIVKPPIMAQASPSRSPGLARCTSETGCGSLSASRRHSTAHAWSLLRSTPLAMAETDGRSDRFRTASRPSRWT